ncbi:MAG: translocation/assembly module TamB domain-containing protein [Pseudomonadota bacterium]|nr:translocation/assembly module TamB domain-containing protein [Pseudomonadota bacterium]
MKKQSKIIVILVLVLSLIISSFVYFLFYTNSGLKLLTDYVNSNYKNFYYLESAHGNLAGEFGFDKIIIKKNKSQVILKNSVSKINLIKLLQQSINVYDIKVREVDFAIDKIITLPIKKLTGEVEFSRSNLEVNLAYTITLPEDSINGKLNIKGKPEKYNVTNLFDSGNYELKLEGTGNEHSINIVTPKSEQPSLLLTIDWLQKVNWNLSLKGNLNSDLDANVDLTSHNYDDDITIEMNKLNIKIHDKNMSLKGKAKIKPDSVVGDIFLKYGGSSATATLELTDKVLLKGSINIPELNDINPELSGSLKKSFVVRGDLDKPEVDLSYDIKDLTYPGLKVEELHGKLNIDKEMIFKSNINIINLVTNYFYFDVINASASGNIEQHNIKTHLKNDLTEVDIDISGSYINNSYMATINKLKYSFDNNITTITNPITMYIRNNKIQVYDVCLSQDNKKMCFNFFYNFTNDEWDMDITTNEFDLSQLGNLKIHDLATLKKGIISGNLKISGKGSTSSKKKGKFQLKNIILHSSKLNVDQKFNLASVDIENDKINFHIENDDKKSKVNIVGQAQQDKITLKFSSKNTELLKIKEMDATVDAELNISLVGSVVKVIGDISIVNGNIKSNIIPDIVTLTKDVNLINGTKVSNAITIHPESQVKLTIDKTDYIDLMNTEGLLSGQILLPPENDEIKATGNLNIENGKYKSFGKNLLIKKGLLTYKNNDIYDPELDIIAVRKLTEAEENKGVKKVEVGIKITGKADMANVKLFDSSNEYSDSEIISLLLVGNTSLANESGYGNKDAGDSIKFGSGILAASNVLDSVSKAMNLDSISLMNDTSDITSASTSDLTSTVKNNLKVGITKKIDDKVLLSLIHGVYTNDFTISLEYELRKGLMLKLYTNELSDGMNIIYKFNTD